MPLEVKIHSWKSVASWIWDAPENELCGICRSKFESTCPSCKIPGDDCPIIWGVCSHVFHMHCIEKWIATDSKQSCPMDRLPWKIKT